MADAGYAKATQTPSVSGAPAQSRSEMQWQRKLLPLMMLMLGGLTLLFTVANIWEVYFLQSRIQDHHESYISDIVKRTDQQLATNAGSERNVSFDKQLEYFQWKVNAVLEDDAMQRRYHQASSSALTRTYIIFIGFTTGMVLALVGATFILGKLHESVSNIDLSGTGLKLTVASASPGLVLATLGTLLMLATMFARAEVNVEDRPVYLQSTGPSHVSSATVSPKDSGATPGSPGGGLAVLSPGPRSQAVFTPTPYAGPSSITSATSGGGHPNGSMVGTAAAGGNSYMDAAPGGTAPNPRSPSPSPSPAATPSRTSGPPPG